MPAWSVLVLGLLLGGCSKKSPEEEMKKLDGEWNVAELSEKGKVADSARLKRMVVSIAEGKLQLMEVIEGKGDTKVGMPSEQFTPQAVQLDVSKDPHEIDLVGLTGDDAGKPRPGIFILEGDTLKICIADMGGTRPASFSADAKTTLMVLERKK